MGPADSSHVAAGDFKMYVETVDVLRTISAAAAFLAAIIWSFLPDLDNVHTHQFSVFTTALASLASHIILWVVLRQIDGLDLSTAVFSTLALIVQLEKLWFTETKRIAWKEYRWCFGPLLASLVLTIVRVILVPHPSRLDLIHDWCAICLPSLCLGALPIAFFPSKEGRIQLDDETAPNAAENCSKIGGKILSLTDDIRLSGGKWRWAMKFYIFYDWVFPPVPWLDWLCAVLAMVLLIAQTCLKILEPHFHRVFYDSFTSDSATSDHRNQLRSLLQLQIVQFLCSATGINSYQNLFWKRFELAREKATGARSFKHIMNHDATFHDASDYVEMVAANSGQAICGYLDFLPLEVAPQLFTLGGAFVGIWVEYGLHYGLLVLCWCVSGGLLLKTSNRKALLLKNDQKEISLKASRHRDSAIRGWRSATRRRVDHEVAKCDATLEEKSKINWAIQVDFTGFTASWSLNEEVTTLLAILGVFYYSNASVAGAAAFQSYWYLLQSTMVFFMKLPDRFLKDLANASRLRQVLEQKPQMKYGLDDLRVTHGSIELRHVTFSHTRADGHKTRIFKKLNLFIKPFTTTALVGPSGVGKTTILDLIERLYDPEKGGHVMIDGKDVTKLRKDALIESIAYMPQEPFIFDDTFKGNIEYGRSGASIEDIQKAAERAAIHDDIMGFPDGYDTLVGYNGGTLSGGQKQRLSLARTFLAADTANILLLDEPTSALDTETEAHIKGIITTAFPDKTIVIIAHRLPTIRHADNIVVFRKNDGGYAEICEEGSHKDLLELNRIYAGLWQKNVGREETIEALFKTSGSEAGSG